MSLYMSATEAAKLPGLVTDLDESLLGNADYAEKRSIVGTQDRLSRFLISRQLVLPLAKEMILNHLNWRKENNVDEWRDYMKDKPFLTSSFPRAKELKAQGLGMTHTAVFAGKSRQGEAIMLEILGAEGQRTDVSDEDGELMKKLLEYYIGFFEKRNTMLEEWSKEQSRLVCTLQIRDVSKLSFMPNPKAFAVLQKIMSIGMSNYPENASTVIFTSPPAIFSAIFAVVKRWIPEEVHRKFRFTAKEDVPSELLHYVRPSVVVALQELHHGKDGDEICKELTSTPLPSPPSVEKTLDITVAARDFHYIYVGLGEGGYQNVSWEHVNSVESPKSKVAAEIYYVDPGTESQLPDKVNVITLSIPGDQSIAQFPNIEGVRDALLCLRLDHTASWIQSHTFKLKVKYIGI